MTRFRSELFEADTAVTRAGATAGRSEAETDARASELSSEYRQGIETIRMFHQSEHVEIKKALDEQICARKDAIEAIKREALNSSNSLKHVINNMDTIAVDTA